jgi:hypothetical protein
MLATIVRSRLALNVGGEEPERSALLRIAKLEDIPPDGDSRHRPDADRDALVDMGAVAGDAPGDGLGGQYRCHLPPAS